MSISGKTQDGKNLAAIVDTMLQIPNVTMRSGSSHSLIAKYSGEPVYGSPGLCAVGKTTSYQRHIVPWVKKVTGYDADRINYAFQQRAWA